MFRLTYVRVLVALFWLIAPVAAQAAQHLSADLSFFFTCKSKPRPSVEKELQAFFTSRGFEVLNQGAIQRKYFVQLFETNLVALSDTRRMLEVRSVPRIEDRYSFALYSPPPTQRVPLVESAILEFVSGQMECEVDQIERRENPENRRTLFEAEFERAKRLFQEGERFIAREPKGAEEP